MHRPSARRTWIERLRHRLAEPACPGDFAHHALLAAQDPRLFDALRRDLRMRLYDGPPRARHAAALRQGVPPRWSRACTVAACLCLAAGAFARQAPVARHATAVHAGIDFVPHAGRAALAGAALAGAGALLAACPRKHVWLVARPTAGAPRIDLWIAGLSNHDEARFAREFAALVRRAAALGRGLDAGRRSARRRASTSFVRDTGSVAST